MNGKSRWILHGALRDELDEVRHDALVVPES